MNQFGADDSETYTIQVNKPLYKLFRRLLTLNSHCEVHLYTDERGRISSLRVLTGKKENLGRELENG